MSKIKIEFPDGSTKKFEEGITPQKIAYSIGEGLGEDTVAAKFDGELVAKEETLNHSGKLKIITPDSEEYVKVLRHTASHILAQAIKRVYPKAKMGIGPATEDGFYYDFDNLDIEEEDLKKIESIMEKIVENDLELKRIEKSKEEAKEILKNNHYKLELLEDIEEGEVTFYKQGDFMDLCKGPHVESTGKVKALKLLSIAGAYWRGNEDNKMLTRIYGTAFERESELEEYMEKLEKAKERDHKKIGKEMDLFSLHEVTGPGLPIYHPKGTIIRKEMMKFIREVNSEFDYKEVWTPHMFRSELWKKSGHYEAFKDDMFIFDLEDEEYAVKPMNCPGHIQIFKSHTRSYRDLPIRYSEFGTVYRKEKRGELSGILRVRALTQDDGHAFIRKDQIQSEIVKMLDMADEILSGFGLQKLEYTLSTKPEKAIGSDEIWENAISDLRDALEEKSLDYEVEEGEGAFYGPKIDIHIKDALGRRWQCSTIQLDFFMPKRFDLEYTGEDGEKHRPIMLHRALAGALDRFLGVLIEHYAGKFPLWLSPEQVRILPIADRHNDYAYEVKEKLESEDIRAEVDERSRTLDYKIREAQEGNIPYMVIVGDNEVETEEIALRDRKEEKKYEVNVEKFLEELKKEIQEKRTELEVLNSF